MQLILLFGGTGKRFSNNVCFKQLSPLLEKENGMFESMGQWVGCQAKYDDIKLAINAGHFVKIANQPSETVSVVTEPERRDTLPTIKAITELTFRAESRCLRRTYEREAWKICKKCCNCR